MEEFVGAKVNRFFDDFPAANFDKGQILFHAGDDPPGIFYLLSGRVRQYDISANGTEAVVNIYKPPAFFPMAWAINQSPNQYFFEAETKVAARLAPAAKTLAFLKSNPDVTIDLLARVFRGTDGLLRRVSHMIGGNAYSRVNYELIIAAKRDGKPQSGGETLIPLSEDALASRAGLSRETINRELGKLKRKNLVSVSSHGINIKGIRYLAAQLSDGL